MLAKYLIVSVAGLFFAVSAASQPKSGKNDGKIEVVFLQLNDVYEISSLDHGKIGGMTRVATIRKELMKYNPRTYTILAGDFLRPRLWVRLYWIPRQRRRSPGCRWWKP